MPQMTSSGILPIVERSTSLAKPERWLSVDVLRGLTISFMILVNNNGDGQRAYCALKHADWNGFTPPDLASPTFLSRTPVSPSFSTPPLLAQPAPTHPIPLH